MRTSLAPLLFALRLMPDALHSEVLARVLTHLARGQSIAGRLGDLHGKCIQLHVVDTGSRLAFRVDGERLRAARPAPSQADVVIRATLADFWLLATRAEDPDTLFFQRRLAIEGDTETGLHIKNLIDALEFDWRAHVTAVLGARAAAPLIALIDQAQRGKRHNGGALARTRR